jgi:hypothetical protein
MQRRSTEAAIEHLFDVNEGLPCPQGTALLLAFAKDRPFDFAFLQPSDLVDFTNSAFAGIPEWDTFSEHYGSCGLCNA